MTDILQQKIQETLRRLIVCGFSTDELMRADLFSIYEELLLLTSKLFHLKEYGYPNEFIPRDVHEENIKLAAEGRKIAVIKNVRRETNLGLKEAKELSEKMYTFKPYDPPSPPSYTERAFGRKEESRW